MIGRLLKFAAMLAFGTSSGVLAQQPPPAPPPPPPQPSTYNQRHPNADFTREYESRMRFNFQDKPTAAQLEARVVADCILKRAKGKAGELLGGTAEDPNFEKLQKGMSGKYSACNREGAAGLPMVALNTALVEQMLRSENRGFAARITPPDVNAAKAFYNSADGVTMDSLGRCLAVYSPGMVQGVLGTPAGSPNETKALEALYAQTPECGVRKSPAGIPANEQRNAVANGLYYWTHRG
ncbi:MAG: hypothetical protein V4513_09455 [Pseudomonadota bacterium]